MIHEILTRAILPLTVPLIMAPAEIDQHLGLHNHGIKLAVQMINHPAAWLAHRYGQTLLPHNTARRLFSRWEF